MIPPVNSLVKFDNPVLVSSAGGKRGDDKLAEIPNPKEGQAYWRVEEEFCNAIRGLEKITRTPFEVGLHYMEFTEAVTRSAQSGQTVPIPL